MPKRNTGAKGKRQVFTYAYLYHCAAHGLEQAEKEKRGQAYNCMISVMFCALTLEAYMNHIGSLVISYWKVLEWLKPTEKLEVLANHIPFAYDTSHAPFKSFPILFRFRNALAHGRTAHIDFATKTKIDRKGRPAMPETEWEKLCTVEDAKRLLADTAAMITTIHEAAEQGDRPFLVLEMAEWPLSVHSSD